MNDSIENSIIIGGLIKCRGIPNKTIFSHALHPVSAWLLINNFKFKTKKCLPHQYFWENHQKV